MRLYSVQRLAAWEAAKQAGLLTVTDERFIDPDYLRSYRWMQGQMAKRLVACSGDLPIWASPQRPDLRRWSWREPKGEEMVLLTLEVPPERVLISDYDAWHFVLNDSFLYLTEAEDQWLEQHPPTQAQKEASWERIFGPFPVWADSPDTEHQACVDRVFLHEVTHVRPFKGRRR